MNLRDALALRVGLPSLHDALALPLDDLHHWLARADDEIRQDDATRATEDPGRLELDEARARVREALDLPPAEELLARPHTAAADDTWPHRDARFGGGAGACRRSAAMRMPSCIRSVVRLPKPRTSCAVRVCGVRR